MNILLCNSFGESEVNIVEMITETRSRTLLTVVADVDENGFFFNIFNSVINGD